MGDNVKADDNVNWIGWLVPIASLVVLTLLFLASASLRLCDYLRFRFGFRSWRPILPLTLAAACGSSGSPTAGPVGKRVGPALAAALEGADRARLPWRCASADAPGVAPETLTIGTRTWQLAGRTLSTTAIKELSIGVIADAGGAAPATLAALGRLRAKLEGVDLVIALGGMGANQAELEATLGALGDRAPWPLIVLPGDLEPVPALARAVAALRQRGIHTLDGRIVRRIEIPGVTIATIAGASSASRLASGTDGCSYAPGDVAATFGELAKQPGLRIVAMAEAPRRSIAGEATGELALVPPAKSIDLVLHGASELSAAPRTGTRDGTGIALSPGVSDSTIRLDGGRRASVGVVTVRGDGWTWRPVVDAP